MVEGPRPQLVVPVREALQLPGSPSGRALSIGSPMLLIALGGYGTVRGGVPAPGFILLLAGAALLGVTALTMPWAALVDATGVHCRTMARLRSIPWDDVVAFERQRRARGGGALLVRTVQGRRIALSDRPERPDQWDALREMVQRCAPGAPVGSPPDGHPFNGPPRSGGSPLR